MFTAHSTVTSVQRSSDAAMLNSHYKFGRTTAISSDLSTVHGNQH
jgi:hypothetical protein